MSAQETISEQPVANVPVTGTSTEAMSVDPTPAAASTDAVTSTKNAVESTSAASTEVKVPEFPEVLRGKTDEEIDAIKKKIVEQRQYPSHRTTIDIQAPF
jgi:hypothetical protein